MHQLTHKDFTIGWLCALTKEQTAAMAMLDEEFEDLDLPTPVGDKNTYTFGCIGKHKIVIACLPKGRHGNNSAATLATQMVRTFPSVRVGLMVGIGGGIPSKVRLGDVVVGTPTGQFPGVVQWDFGKAEINDKFTRTGSLNNPPMALLTALTKMGSKHELKGPRIPQYLESLRTKFPRLIEKYTWSDSRKDPLAAQGESSRSVEDVRIHYGLIASGNQVIKDAKVRDRINDELDGHVLCLEMEAAGLMDFPCLVIRGICDYADSTKNDGWQECAAAVAAALAKDLLGYVKSSEVEMEQPIRDILDKVHQQTSTIRKDVDQLKTMVEAEEITKILHWLTPYDYSKTQDDHFHSLQRGTLQWFLESEDLKNWLDESNKTLFCLGMQGVGKTILSSALVNYIQSNIGSENSSMGLAYIYCNYRRQHEQDAIGMLASILKQLCQSLTTLPDIVRDMYKPQTRPSEEKVLRALHSVAAMFPRSYIIIDALDECGEDLTRFLRLLITLQSSRKTSIFATSRKTYDDISRFNHVNVINIRAKDEDMKAYLNSHMEKLPVCIWDNHQLQEEITSGILESVDGMFLLAHLSIGLFRDKHTPNLVRETLADIKNQKGRDGGDNLNVLSRVYDQTMERINGQMQEFKKLALQVLAWVTYAKRELTTSEIQHALGTRIGKSELDYDDIPRIDDMVSVCTGLVTVDKMSNVIRPVHYTTQSYLEETLALWYPQTESYILDTCVTYLSFTTFNSGPCYTIEQFYQRVKSNSLYRYAANHWGYHTSNDTMSSEVVLRFLESYSKVNASSQAMNDLYWFRGPYSGHIEQGITGLHLAGYFGLNRATQALINLKYEPNQEDRDNRTSLWYAASKGHVICTDLLLKAGADAKRVHILMKAAGGGHLEVVERLLAAGADATSSDVLEAAAGGGHLEVVERLLAAGADATSSNALEAAADGGYLEVVKRLLAAGADATSGDALWAAADGGYPEVVERLLAAGADATSSDALWAAADGGCPEVVKRLLAAGADATSSDALEAAADRGYPEVVKILLAAGADATSGDVLKAAAGGGHLEVVKRLLAAGANVNSSDVLEAAAGGGHLEVVKRLLAAGADATRSDILWTAATEGHLEVVERLLAIGVDATRSNALWTAANRGHLEVVERLLAAGADANRNDALEAAARRGYLEVVKRLLAAGADATSSDALWTAADGGYLEVVERLLAAGADATSGDVLKAAAGRGHLEVVKRLQAAGASATINILSEAVSRGL